MVKGQTDPERCINKDGDKSQVQVCNAFSL